MRPAGPQCGEAMKSGSFTLMPQRIPSDMKSEAGQIRRRRRPRLMSPRLKRAVRAYMRGLSVADAARCAGLARETVSRGIHRPAIARHIAMVQRRRDAAASATELASAGLRAGTHRLDVDGFVVPTEGSAAPGARLGQ